MKRTLLATTLVLLLWGTPALAGPAPCGATDTDGDTVPDCADNCSEVANAAQDDTDGDDCGNLCDADYDNDGFIGFSDFGMFSSCFLAVNCPDQQHSEPVDPARQVGFADFGYFSTAFNGPPAGPSGTTAGTTACP
jgi:hypothetical protein